VREGVSEKEGNEVAKSVKWTGQRRGMDSRKERGGKWT